MKLLANLGLATAIGPAIAQSFTNPILWEDLADIDILRVDDVFYYSASTMAYSPGAPILRSYDLLNWEYIGHSVPTLDFGPAFSLDDNERAYVKGIWASALNYRPSTATFHWLGCIQSTGKTYVYSALAPEGPWTQTATLPCYYDAGMLVDTTDAGETIYVASGNTNISVSQLSSDFTTEVRSEVVFPSPADIGYIEGSRFYHINGNYYIWVTRPATDQFVLKSTDGPWGPYEAREVIIKVTPPVEGAGAPHQGGLVDTPDGNWWYMAFIDAYPGGRIPVLAPVVFDEDGWPSVTLDDAGGWGVTYPLPVTGATGSVAPIPTSYGFNESALGAEWEWNHNPDNEAWSIGGGGGGGAGLVLRTASVTGDLYQAKNTLTRRIPGPKATGTLKLDVSGMVDGDVAGLALFRDSSAWIGVRKEGGAVRVSMTSGLAMNADWTTLSTGAEEDSADLEGGEVFLQVTVDITPGVARTASFGYSLDGDTFTALGGAFTLNSAWQYFIGYRFGIFNYATVELGGEVNVLGFEIQN